MKDLNTYIKEALNIQEALRLKKGKKLVITFETVDNGVYLFYKDGSISKEVKNPEDVIGVVVVTDDCKFVIDKNDSLKGYHEFGCDYVDLSSSTIICTADETEALKDFNGQENTNALIKYMSARAAKLCYDQEYDINGKKVHGYLGSLGEWKAIYDNTEKINQLLKACKGNQLNKNWYWTSTADDNSVDAWLLDYNMRRPNCRSCKRKWINLVRPLFKPNK